MHLLSARIWQQLRRSQAGRLCAAALIAAPFGALAAAEISPTRTAIIFATLGASALGVVAVVLLEFRDHRRSQTTEWQRRVTRTTTDVRELYPHIPAEHAREVAKAVEENRFTPIVWVGMALGGFSLACGAATLIVRVIQFLLAR